MNKKKKFVLLIVTANFLFAWSFFYMFYYKDVFFDSSEKVELKQSNIEKITNGDGSWKWKKTDYDFYKDYSFSLTKYQISEFIKIVNKSDAKYIENIRPQKWFDINVIDKNGNQDLITLKQNYEGEIYFDINNKTFDGNELEKYLYNYIKRN